MTIEYKDKQILDNELNLNRPYIGYFSPNGNLVDLEGKNHSDYHSILAKDFLTYTSFIQDNELHVGFYNKNNDYELLMKKLNNHIDNLDKVDDLKTFEYQLLLFFKKAYQNNNFFESIGRKIVVDSNHKCIRKTILTNLKDICIQYLGYDCIERYNSTGIKIELDHETVKPRLITSTYNNINERYYNYLLMDWEVKKFPRYKFNEESGLFILDNNNDFYESENEEVLEEEIKSIKKSFSKEERHQFFR
ncbi:MAG: hypothetical protein IJ097_00300 [Bacilli bacterium]|nr:hypothetical protein [Bacilli bacterium]